MNDSNLRSKKDPRLICTTDVIGSETVDHECTSKSVHMTFLSCLGRVTFPSFRTAQGVTSSMSSLWINCFLIICLPSDLCMFSPGWSINWWPKRSACYRTHRAATSWSPCHNKYRYTFGRKCLLPFRTVTVLKDRWLPTAVQGIMCYITKIYCTGDHKLYT